MIMHDLANEEYPARNTNNTPSTMGGKGQHPYICINPKELRFALQLTKTIP